MNFLFAPFKRKLTFVVMINNTRKEEREKKSDIYFDIGLGGGGSKIHGHACQPDHLISFLELIA